MGSTEAAASGRAGLAGSGAATSVDRFFELSLLGLISSGYLAVLGSGYLDAPTAILTALGLLLRGLMVTGVVRLHISTRLTAALTAGYSVFYGIDYLLVSENFLTATVHMVFFLAVVKVLTAESTRDHVLVAVIAFLELLAASVLATGLSFFVFLALFLFFGVAAFASAEIRRSIRKPRNVSRAGLRTLNWRLAGLTAAVAFAILALTGGLFFLLPRTAQAAFQHLVPQRYHIPGFSNEMILGSIGRIQQRSTPVMHVRFSLPDQPRSLKWRGNALTRFDGQRWYNSPEPGDVLPVEKGLIQLARPQNAGRFARGIRYEVQLNSIASDTLFFAGRPAMLWINAPAIVETPQGGYRLRAGSSGGLRYDVFSYLEQISGEGGILPADERIDHLLLPQVDPRVIALAREVTQGQTSDEGRALAIQRFLWRNFAYTTELLSREVDDPLAHFLLERRQGHCEYFASAMAVMLRIVNVPTRVATGFQSGLYNPVSGWWVIRASDAHSWVEAWLPGHGWVTFDPTPPDPNASGPGLWSKLGLYLDAAQTFWQEWVLNYDLDRQLDLASQVESTGRSFGVRWMDRFRAAVWTGTRSAREWTGRYGLVLGLGILAFVAAWRYGPRAAQWWSTRRRVKQLQRGGARASDATLLYRRMLAVLKRRGMEKPGWLTPSEFAHLLPASETAALVEDFTLAYNDLRFGGNLRAAPRMVALLEALEKNGRA